MRRCHGVRDKACGMEPLIQLLLLGALVAMLLLAPAVLRSWRRSRLRRSPFPAEWEGVLRERLGPYARMPPPLQEQLRRHILVFLGEKRFYGCGGLAITDAMRVLIAARACLLLLNRDTDYYGRLRSILVYPSAFLVNREFVDEAGIHTVGREARIGESWEIGRVILAWDEVEGDESDRPSGTNVVLHEFAHQLDQEDGVTDGTPVLADASRYRMWAEVLGKEFRALREKVSRGEGSLLDHYGAEDAGEFFAVATESFFEQPDRLSGEHPALYAVLRDYYRVDPAAWPEMGPPA